jgi:hypothetical protein
VGGRRKEGRGVKCKELRGRRKYYTIGGRGRRCVKGWGSRKGRERTVA